MPNTLKGLKEPRDIRREFPIFVHNKDLVFLDNASTTQKPAQVIQCLKDFYEHSYANIHRGVYRLSEEATRRYEAVRDKVAFFLGGVESREIIFTSGVTDSINLIAFSWCQKFLKPGDEILLTVLEHHSNLVPWQLAAERSGAHIKYIPLTPEHRLDCEKARELITTKTKIVSFAHVSNVLGTISPIKHLIELAHSVGAIVVIDGAQAVPHFDVNVLDLDCDFYAFTGHKLLGPSGVGVLYGKAKWLEAMPPYRGGGQMIRSVKLEGSTWADIPYKIEAGTPPIADVIGLGAAIDYLQTLDRVKSLAHDLHLGNRLLAFLATKHDVRTFVKDSTDWVGVVAFHHKGIHPHDMSAFMDAHQVCVRGGHHCAEPLMKFLGVPATLRVSAYIYNHESDIEIFMRAFHEAEKTFNHSDS
jgi:SufS family cysteine desulfurase